MTYYAWIAIFAMITYIIISDRNVADAFVYIFDIVRNKTAAKIWWLKNNPQTPWARYSMWRRSNQLAKELMREMEENNEL